MILAYLDPGFGSMIFQTIIAGVLTVPFIFWSTTRRIIDRLRRRRRP